MLSHHFINLFYYQIPFSWIRIPNHLNHPTTTSLFLILCFYWGWESRNLLEAGRLIWGPRCSRRTSVLPTWLGRPLFMTDLEWRRACLPTAASTTCILRVALTVLHSRKNAQKHPFGPRRHCDCCLKVCVSKAFCMLNMVQLFEVMSSSVETAITWQTTGQFLKQQRFQSHIYGDWEMEDQMSAGLASWESILHRQHHLLTSSHGRRNNKLLRTLSWES